jgi:hypothetical protein
MWIRFRFCDGVRKHSDEIWNVLLYYTTLITTEPIVAAIRITPVIDGNRAFIEWSGTFDCAEAECDEKKKIYENAFRNWLESLRASPDRFQPDCAG